MLDLTNDQLRQVVLNTFGTKPYLITNPRNLSVTSLDLLFATVFNFGGQKQFNQLESELGIKIFASIFRKLDAQSNTHLLPMTNNYLRLYFNKHSPI